MDIPDLALRFAVALGLGMLIGLERERSKPEEGGAGVRTFALIALTGAIAGLTDVDAFALAIADLAKTDESSIATAARAMVVV
jgi:uncharacterized membrane protein YhiD involved in acid resistance